MIQSQAFKKFLLVCLLIFAGCESFKPEQGIVTPTPGSPAYFYELGLESRDVNEKLHYYNTGLDAVKDVKDTSLVALLEGKIYAYNRLGEFLCTSKWIDSLINTAKLQNDQFYLAKGYYRKSELNRYLSRPEQEYEYAFLSRQAYLKMGDTAYAGRRSLDMANAQLKLGDYSGAQETATEALKLLDRELDSAYVSSAHNVVGLAYSELGFQEEARKEYESALSFAVSQKDSLSYLHNIALVYKNEENYDAALQIFGKLIEAKEFNTNSKNRFLDNYAYTKWLKDPETKIDAELLKVLENRRLANDKDGEMTTYSHLIDYYFKTDKALARKYAEAYLNLAREYSGAAFEIAALRKIIALSEGEAKENYVNRYLLLNDSLNKANLQTKFRFAKIRFDEERKEQQISFLEAENLIHSIKAERLKTGNTISSLSALLFLLIAGTVYYYFIQRGKREKIKQIYLTESRISKKIHDELANDIYNVLSALEPVASPPVVDRLEKIYLRTRDFSRENSEIDTGENYLKDLLSFLSNSVPPGTKIIVQGEESINWNKFKTEKKIVLYRVLQEMIVNMKKHSDASFVALVFSSEKELLKIRYSDNGKGADKNDLESGNGIKNLQARLKTVNGTITFETRGVGLKAEISVSFS